MNLVDIRNLIGPFLCIIGAVICWFTTVNNSRRKSPLIAGIILIITGIVLTEIVMHSQQDLTAVSR